MERLSYRPISLDDFEPYAEFLADPECTRYLLVPEPHSRELTRGLLERNVEQHDGTIGMYTLHDGLIHLIHPENAASLAVAKKLGAAHERDTEILGGPVSIYATNRRS